MGGSNGMFDPGNVNVAAPYFVSGRSLTITALAPGDPVAQLVQFGMLDPRTPGAIVATPIRISQIRIKYAAVTADASGVAFEVIRGTSTAQATTGTGAATHAPQRRKTSGYPAIGLTETSLFMLGSDLIGGGNFTALDATAPIDVAAVGGVAQGSESVWMPSDLCGHVLEAGEALQVRNVGAFTGTGILFVAFDFLR